MQPRTMDLTPELVAKVHRVEPDDGPPAGIVLLNDQDYDDIAARLLQELNDAPLNIFAYGSLIWKPEVAHVASARGTLSGFHRSFCLRLDRFRGTRAFNGLMMALEEGGQCEGMIYTLPEDEPHAQVVKLLRREMSYKPANNMPYIVNVDTNNESVAAITFSIRKDSPYRAAGLPLPEVAAILARAAGHFGSGAEYLYNTVLHLEKNGIVDDNLWELQRIVASEIRKL